MKTGWSDGGRGELRAAHADRQEVLALLRVAGREGRLDGAELDRRSGAAEAAGTRADLVALTADLPARPRAREWVDGWRVRAADREQAAAWLAAGGVDGRLTGEECAQRQAVLPAVVDYAQLKRLLAGLPGPSEAIAAELLPAWADRDTASAVLAAAIADGRANPVEEPVLGATIRHARRVADLDAVVADLTGRVGDLDRSRLVDRLDEAHRAGQLDIDEHRRRVARAGSAETGTELEAIAADLAARRSAAPDGAAAVERRLTDEDRREVVDRLRRAVDDGRLDLPRYEERVRAALAATTEEQVAPLLADLVPPPRPARRGPLDAVFDEFVVNSALLPAPRGRLRLVSKGVWKAMVLAGAVGYAAGMAIFPQDGADLLLYNIFVPVLGIMALVWVSGRWERAWSGLVAELTAGILADLRSALSDRPGVREAEVVVKDGEEILVRLTVAAGTDSAPLAEEAVRLLWQSRLRSIGRVYVVIYGASDESEFIDPRIGSRKAELRHRYGRRPYGPLPVAQPGLRSITS